MHTRTCLLARNEYDPTRSPALSLKHKMPHQMTICSDFITLYRILFDTIKFVLNNSARASRVFYVYRTQYRHTHTHSADFLCAADCVVVYVPSSGYVLCGTVSNPCASALHTHKRGHGTHAHTHTTKRRSLRRACSKWLLTPPIHTHALANVYVNSRARGQRTPAPLFRHAERERERTAHTNPLRISLCTCLC